RRSACARTITPPSEVIRPPSNAAVIFLPATAGKANGRTLSLVMAGVVRHDRVNRMVLAPNSYARPIRYATPANIQIPSLVESRKGAVAHSDKGTPFPFPAHQTGRADFRHPAFRPASS